MYHVDKIIRLIISWADEDQLMQKHVLILRTDVDLISINLAIHIQIKTALSFCPRNDTTKIYIPDSLN